MQTANIQTKLWNPLPYNFIFLDPWCGYAYAKLQISRQNLFDTNVEVIKVWSLKDQRVLLISLEDLAGEILVKKTVWSVLPWNSWSNFCKAHATLIQDNSGLRSFGMENVGYIVMVRWGWTNSIIIFKGMSDWNQSTIPHSGLTPEDKKSTYFTSFFIIVILTSSLKYWKVSENLRPNLFGGLKRAMG